MGLHGLGINEMARLNMSASARMTLALKVNDIGTAQRIAASMPMGQSQVRQSAPVQAAPPHRSGVHQIDVWA